MGITRFGVSMEHELVDLLDKLIEREGYANRSEAIRSLVRKEIIKKVPEDDSKEVAGIVTLVFRYGHRNKEVPTKDFPSLKITANLHLHIHKDICQKIITVQGSGKDVIQWAKTVISQKGVIGSFNIVASEEIYSYFQSEQEHQI